MKVIMCVQLSPCWWEARRGLPTASAFDRILTPSGKVSGQQDDLIAELLGDTLALHPNAMTERPMNAAMRHGVECEPEARHWYTLQTGRAVQQVGFCLHDSGRFGCSPDGLVGEEGVLELKCVQPKTQVKYLLAGGLPGEYRPQCHGHLLVTGRPWCDFLSYCPGLDPVLVRVTPDEYTAKLVEALGAFLERLERARAALGPAARKDGAA